MFMAVIEISHPILSMTLRAHQATYITNPVKGLCSQAAALGNFRER